MRAEADILEDRSLVISGAPLGEASAAAILLHGRNRSPEEMIDLAVRLDLPGFAYLAPAAPDASWYPVSFLAPVAENEPRLSRALEQVDGVVRALTRRGFARERLVLVGFSQGACLACEYLFRNPARWGALVAFTGGLIGPPGTAWAPSGYLGGTPVLLAGSDVDAWVPLERVTRSAEVFRTMGGAVEERVYPGREHVVCDDEILAARALLAPLGRGAPREREEA